MRNLNRRTLFNCSIGIFVLLLFALVDGMTAAHSPVAPTAPAQKKAAGPCGDKSKRYFDCGNGTVTDSITGLIWLKDSNCMMSLDWEAARKAAANLKDGDCMLKDGSAAGDWRLPTREEWQATMEKAKALNCTGPVLTNDAGTGCISAGPSPFPDPEADYYWSSTKEGDAQAYLGDIDHGNLLKANLINSVRVWPVRGGAQK